MPTKYSPFYGPTSLLEKTYDFISTLRFLKSLSTWFSLIQTTLSMKQTKTIKNTENFLTKKQKNLFPKKILRMNNCSKESWEPT